jgi:CubicO group peptidase (beta-lactamase class C family)
MQHLFHLFLLLHVLAATGRLAAAPLDALPGPEKPSPLDTFILEGMKEAKVPGLAALVIRDGNVAWSGYYGWANVETRTPVSRDTRFQLASVSKTVTACAIMQQVEQGKLDLDADINSVLPFTVRNPGHPDRPITLRHLLTHSSGIKDNWDLLEDTWVKNGDFPKPLGKSCPEKFLPLGTGRQEHLQQRRHSPGRLRGRGGHEDGL